MRPNLSHSSLFPLVAWLLTAALNGCGSTPPPVVSDPELAPGHAGSASCQPCHPEVHAAWAGSIHFHNLAPMAQARVLGDFERKNEHRFAGTRSRMFKEHGRFFMEYTGLDGRPATWSVDYALGIERHQVYLHREADGRLQTLPTYWNVATGAWEDQREGPVVDGPQPLPQSHPAFWRNYTRTFNRACLECHASQPRKRFDGATVRYDSRFDPPINCEACHGPGAEHVAAALTEQAQRGPATGQAAATPAAGVAASAGASRWLAGDPGAWPVERRIESCAACHARKRIYQEGYVPGRPMADYFVPDVWDAGFFWVDGRSGAIDTYNYAEFLQAACQRRSTSGLDCNGPCHAPHSSRVVRVRTVAESNAPCVGCHVRHGTDLTAHTFHGPESDGSRCIECHMPVKRVMGMRLRDHTIGLPHPELTRRFRVPNACNGCHGDDSPDWAEQKVQEWYGERPTYQAARQQALERAEVLSRIFAGEPPPVEPLIRWLDDPAGSLIQRASAARWLGQATAEPAAIEALQRHRHDPHPFLRFWVIDALSRIPAGQASLREALTDRRRTVRVRAYEGLLRQLPGIEKETDAELIRVRGEYDHRVAVARADDPRWLAATAAWHQREGRLAEAEQYLRHSVAVGGGVLEFRLELFRFLMGQRRLGEAEAEVRLLEAAQPGSLLGAATRAELLLAQGRVQEAGRLLLERIDRGGDVPPIRLLLNQAFSQGFRP